MLPDPRTLLEIAHLKQDDFLAEARRDRLANAIRTPVIASLSIRCVAAARAVSRRVLARPAPATPARSRQPALPNAPA